MTLPNWNDWKKKELLGHKSKVHTLGWSKDGSYLASGSMDHSIKIWATDLLKKEKEKEKERTCIIELKGHQGSIDQLCWDPIQSERLVSISGDKTVRLWDIRNGACVAKLSLHAEMINVCWSPDGEWIAVGDKHDLVSFIHVATFKVENKSQFTFEVNEMTWNKAGAFFLITTGMGTVNVLEWPSLKAVATLQGHTANCYCIKMDPKERYFASGGADALIGLWDLNEMLCLRTFTQLDWPVRTLSFSHDGTLLAAGSEDLVVDISDVETGQSVHQIKRSAPTNAVAWHPSCYILAYAGDEMDRNGRYEGNIHLFGEF